VNVFVFRTSINTDRIWRIEGHTFVRATTTRFSKEKKPEGIVQGSSLKNRDVSSIEWYDTTKTLLGGKARL
jgi:hypothetical protein